MSAKDDFYLIFNRDVQRPGADKLLAWLAGTDFFEAPASTRFHGSHPGGLVQHSLNVYDRLGDLLNCVPGAPDVPPESRAICALLHDVCKIENKKEINGNGNTRACAREDAPDGAAPPPPPPTSPEEFWTENGFGQSISNAAKCLAPYRATGCTDGLILRALEIAADNGAPRWVYARSILDRAVSAGTLTAEAFEATRRPRGCGRNALVDRQTPSGNDMLAAAADRPRRLKRKD